MLQLVLNCLLSGEKKIQFFSFFTNEVLLIKTLQLTNIKLGFFNIGENLFIFPDTTSLKK